MSKETNPLREEPKCTLSDNELIEKCQQWVHDLAESGGKKWSLRVPVDFNRDPDMLFLELCKRLQSQSLPEPEGEKDYPWEVEKQNEQLKRKLDFYRDETAKIREYVFDDKNQCGKPCQSIFEAITDKIDALRKENEQLKSQQSLQPEGKDREQVRIVAAKVLSMGSRYGQDGAGITASEIDFATDLILKYTTSK